MMMKRLGYGFLLSLGLGLATASPGWSLPGQTVIEVAAWIQANSTLRPGPGERLLVNRIDTPAQRFTFQASIFPPGTLRSSVQPRQIRTERIALFDMINGVSFNRLEESLRVIYGTDIFSDYQRSQPVYVYPTADSPVSNNPNLLIQGEIREGDRYAYWIQTTSDRSGSTDTGEISILLKEDIPGLLSRLQEASALPE
ncbi:MAG: hypothetical protein HC886_14015 [Leptolyngbyaceae cyanobacterium SM1_1_3]|nr:hypothetical protein [Leptolyngbyaceae cyanobacterium SM1_1_3]NJN04481.1 hypothetical protein [Leptolyngbyaceae cyanobacterium RM1_1_2]NJO10675.1 hypothetical protein [Leptolyngbyaceae cyanobacterium SL_1_1]